MHDSLNRGRTVDHYRLAGCNYRPRHHLLWRRITNRARSSKHTLTLRLNVSDDFVRNGCTLNLSSVNPDDVVADGPCVHERLLIHHGDSASFTLVDVGNVGDLIDGHVVVNIRDLNVGDVRVRDVHVLYVTRTGAIPRHINFSRRQWEPSHADANTDVKSTAADEGNERR